MAFYASVLHTDNHFCIFMSYKCVCVIIRRFCLIRMELKISNIQKRGKNVLKFFF